MNWHVERGESSQRVSRRSVAWAPKRLLASAALALLLTLAVPASGVGAAGRAALNACSGELQQSTPQSMVLTSTCTFPANWYRLQAQAFDFTLAAVPPGWQAQYGYDTGGHYVILSTTGPPNPPNVADPLPVFLNPPGTITPKDFFFFASVDLGNTSIPVYVPAPFKSKGSFDTTGTKVGVDTDLDEKGAMTIEKNASYGIELVFQPDDTVSQCDDIAVIQTIRIVDENGDTKYRSDLNADERVPNFAAKDNVAKNADGNAVDVNTGATNPYYGYGTHGSSDGAGHGKDGSSSGVAHISDAPTILKEHKKWKLLFEDWSVCIAGENVGEFMAGATWELAWDDTDMDWKATITDKKPAKPSDGFKKAVKEWEKQNPGFSEPGTGWQW